MTSAPERRWICEAQKPGKPSFEFETFGEEAARAMCDLKGWDFIRCYQEGSHSDRPEKLQPAAALLISAKQLKALIAEAQDTYRKMKDLLDLPNFDDWRKAELMKAAKVDSFKVLPNAKFMKVRNHFRNLRGASALGNSYEAKRQSRERGDTLETRQRQMYLIAQVLGNHARVMEAKLQPAAITIDYLLTIARAKNKGQAIQDIDDLIKLPTSRLEQLLYTIRNRIAAKEGRGDKSNRNKGQ